MLVSWLTQSCLVFAFRAWLGGEEVINSYCRKLAVDGAKRLAEVMGTRVLDESGELTLNMVNRLALAASHQS